MRSEARGFLVSLAAAAGAAAISGGAAAVVVSLNPPGSGGVSPAIWGLAVLPVAFALVFAGSLSRTAVAVLLNSLACLLPLLAATLAVFFLFAHPGGAAGQVLVLATGEFWVKVAAAYAAVAFLVGVRRSRSGWHGASLPPALRILAGPAREAGFGRVLLDLVLVPSSASSARAPPAASASSRRPYRPAPRHRPRNRRSRSSARL